MKTNAFVKQLASNKRTVRDNALATLKKYLSSREKSKPLTTLELLKLWKGLYFTMWFSDRPLPQQRLANNLASLFSDCVVDEQFLNFVEAFWTIMNRQWRELDKWRVDKFYMLMRYVIRECFVKLQKDNWEEKQVDLYLQVLMGTILSDDSKYPIALQYHVIDVWVDELERVLFLQDEDEGDEENDTNLQEKLESEEDRLNRIEKRKQILQEQNVPMDKLLKPFKAKMGRGHLQTLKEKVLDEILEDSRLLELGVDVSYEKLTKSKAEEDNEDEEDEEDEEEEEGDEDEDEDEEEWKGFGN
ncbi:Rrp1 protein [Martiniozyma asiatica (nom. inval.)]|nr:Rrp1 protein [Martiniozyma asiatica]